MKLRNKHSPKRGVSTNRETVPSTGGGRFRPIANWQFVLVVTVCLPACESRAVGVALKGSRGETADCDGPDDRNGNVSERDDGG